MSSDQQGMRQEYSGWAPPQPGPQPSWPAPQGEPVSAPATSVPPPQQRLRPEQTAATRYLCAAPYLDEKFARRVLDEVLHQRQRGVAPSFGFSLGPVIRHCLAARRRTLLRDAVITGLLLVGLLVSFSTGALLLAGLFGAWLVGRGVKLLIARQVVTGTLHLVAAAVLVPLVAGALLTQLAAALLSSVLGSLVGYPSYGEDYGDTGGSGAGVVWLAILLAVWGTYLAHRLAVHHTIAVELTPQAYDPGRAPAAGAAHAARLDYLEHAQRGNVSVYSEETDGHQFIGFGQVVTEFSLVTPLDPAAAAPGPAGAPGDPPPHQPFTVDQLYEAFRSGFAALSAPDLPADQVVPHLSVHDRVFVAGRLPSTSPFLWSGRPLPDVADPGLLAVQRGERGRVRHYQTVRMAAWSGELEVTAFVHAAVRGQMLFVEFVATVVPGIRAAYHRIDTYDRLDARSVLLAVGRSAVDTLRSPIAVGRLVAAGWNALRRELAASSDHTRVDRQLMYDYGCRASVRELAADFVHPVPFQLYDADERISLVQRRLLRVVVRFLTERGYDVTDLVGQATTVINNSTSITNTNTFTGSTLVGSSVAAGSGARASATSTKPVPPPAAPGARP